MAPPLAFSIYWERERETQKKNQNSQKNKICQILSDIFSWYIGSWDSLINQYNFWVPMQYPNKHFVGRYLHLVVMIFADDLCNKYRRRKMYRQNIPLLHTHVLSADEAADKSCELGVALARAHHLTHPAASRSLSPLFALPRGQQQRCFGVRRRIV